MVEVFERREGKRPGKRVGEALKVVGAEGLSGRERLRVTALDREIDREIIILLRVIGEVII
jgi:hypothetical protein